MANTMKKFKVTWYETHFCTKVVEAESEEEAMDECYDLDEADSRRFEETSDWAVLEIGNGN